MVAHPNSWMTKELFMNWLCHFVASVPSGVSHENGHMFIFYGQVSHIALQTIEVENTMGIGLLTFPAHTSHWLQPLDLSVFGPFKIYFKGERAAWMEIHLGEEVKGFELDELASKAFKRALTPSNIKVGFRRTGIWPLNYDALLHDMACIQAFDVHGQEDADAGDNILSLSQAQCQPLGDDDEHVSATQYDNEAPQENMEFVGA